MLLTIIKGMADILTLNMANTKTWDEFINLLQKQVPFIAPWLYDLEPVTPVGEKSENGIFLVKTSQAFAATMLLRYKDTIEALFEDYTGFHQAVNFIVDSTVKKKKPVKKQQSEQSEIQKTAQKMEQNAQMFMYSGLNSKYTFENFVEGENSRYAYRIAQMVAQTPGKNNFNPLFITGSVGLGKTHLMQAIGHQIIKNFRDLKIKYIKAEEFGNQLIESLTIYSNSSDRNQKMKKFRDTFRYIDVLLIDDIQWIDGKSKTEEEIFCTFDALYNAGKQIVFASDRPLSAFELIPDRLKSRFERGTEVTIQVPDLETREKIVKRYALQSNFPISDEVAHFLASEFNENVRVLEGAYNKASAMASIDGVELTIERVNEYLKLDERKKKVTIADIIEMCSKYFAIAKGDILSNARAKDIVNARKYAIFLSREMLDLSFPKLSEEFKKNHTTVLYQHEKLKKAYSSDKKVQNTVNELKELILKKC